MIKLLKTSLLTALSLMIIGAPLLLADWIESGTPVCTDSSLQKRIRMTTDGANGAVLAWEDYRDGDWHIYAQRIDSYGSAQWTVDGIRVSDPLYAYESIELNHDIEAIGFSGSVVLAWEDHLSQETDLYCQILTSSGTPLLIGGETILCDYSGDQVTPQILYSQYDRIIITWFDNRSSGWAIYAQRLTPSGRQLWTGGGKLVVNLHTDHLNSDITFGGGGESIIAFEDYRYADVDIFAERFDTTGTVEWSGGIDVCTAAGDQTEPQVVSDGKTLGAIFAWLDFRDGTDLDIYAQRVDQSGKPQWTTDGVVICAAGQDQLSLQLIPDESGNPSGAIMVWVDWRNYPGNGTDIYAQRIDGSGTVLWTAHGVQVCGASGFQTDVHAVMDCSGGAIVTWRDHRNGSDDEVYAQRIDPSGNMLWEPDGVNLSVEAANQLETRVVCDENGPAIVAWEDLRSGHEDVYAQMIDFEERVGYLPPVILSASDIPGDEGGLVRLTIERSTWDAAGWYSHPAATYNVWRRVDDPVLLSAIEEGTYDPIKGEVSREFLQAADFPPGTWEIIGSFAACQETEYIYAAGTLADSTSGGIPWSAYLISVHTTTPSIWYMSEPDSGYSVDNNSPAPPMALSGEQSQSPEGLQLSWDENEENDLWYYAVYRGTEETFTPGTGNMLATPTDPEYFDGGWEWETGYWYKLSAVDIHGNESGYAVLGPTEITGDDMLPVPEASYLSQNYPNPFNPCTTISFGLKQPSRVMLAVYDAAGRRVKTLLDGDLPAGTYEESWDGRDDSGSIAASGVYFYKLTANDFSKTRKMILLR